MTDDTGAIPLLQVTGVALGTLVMGTYRIEKLINAGGMGEVYRGRNIHNDEPVAIKIVLPVFASDPKYVALLLKESTVLSRLSHEAIVRYHVFTNDPTIGRPCLVMEFVSGISLAQRMTSGAMSLGEVRAMFLRVAAGLERAHRAGVVHRDLSPDNVILEDGLVEQAKLIDFGIAKATKLGTGTLLQGQLAGKLNYMSPEQLGAFGGEIDGRSDIYSLALVIAGACSGTAVDMGSSIVDAVTKRSSVPDLSAVYPDLRPLLAQMLEPDPANRPGSMAKVISQLNRPHPAQDALLSPEVPQEDGNRTFIGGALPVQDSSVGPVGSTTGSLSGQSQPPDVAAPAWPRSQAFDKQTILTPRSLPTELLAPIPIQPSAPSFVVPDAQDDSPFGAPPAAVPSGWVTPPAPRAAPSSAPSPTPGGGKSGLMIAGLAVLIVAGGAAAWISGAFGPNPQDVTITAAAPSLPEDLSVSAPPAPAVPAPAVPETSAAELAAEAAAVQAEVFSQDIDAAMKQTEFAAATAASAAAEANVVSDPALAETEALKAETAAASAVTSRDKAVVLSKKLQLAVGEAAAFGPAEIRAKAAFDLAAASLAAADKAVAAASASAAAARQVATTRTIPLRQRDWLTSRTPAPCTFLQASAVGLPLSLKGTAATPTAFDALSRDFATAFGSAPAIEIGTVSAAHCAVLDISSLNAGATSGVTITETLDTVKSGGRLEARIEGAENRHLRVFLINGAGGVFSLAGWTKWNTTGSYQVSVPLGLENASEASPQMIMAIATEKPLAELDTLEDGYSAETLMPRLQWWLDQSNQTAAIAFQPFRLEL